MKFKNMNEALNHLGYGMLNTDGINHAYGNTDRGIRVWLPIVTQSDEWENLVTEIGGEELILQKGLIGSSHQHKEPDMITSHVITREKIIGERYWDYNDIGEYKQVLFDEGRLFTVHAKVPPFTLGGISRRTGTLVYDPNFANTDQEAQRRADELWNELNKQQGAR